MEKIKKEALEFLKRNTTMVVATVAENGWPQYSLVYFVTNDDFDLYFLTSKKSRKYDNLRYSEKVSFVIGRGPEVVTIQGAGLAKELGAREAQTFYEVMEKIAIKDAKQWPLPILAKEGFATFKITPMWMSMLDLQNSYYADAKTENFHKIV